MEIDILAKPIKPAQTTVAPTSQGKKSDKTELGVGKVESSLLTRSSALNTGDKKLTVSKDRTIGDIVGEHNRCKMATRPSVNISNKEHKDKAVSRSPEQVVTVRPQYGRLIPELSPKSQRVKTAVSPPASLQTTGTVRAVFTVTGRASSPHLKTSENPVVNTSNTGSSSLNTSDKVIVQASHAVSQKTADVIASETHRTTITEIKSEEASDSVKASNSIRTSNSLKPEGVVSTSGEISVSTSPKPVFANVYGRSSGKKATTITTTVSSVATSECITSAPSRSIAIETKPVTTASATSNSVSLPTCTIPLVLHHTSITTSLSSLPAGNFGLIAY